LALVKMKRIELVGLNSERKRLIEYLQQCGIVDISDSRYGMLESRETAQSISRIDSNMAQVQSVLSVLPNEKKGFFDKRPEIASANYSLKSSEVADVMETVKGIERISKTISKNKDEIATLTVEENTITTFLSLDVGAGVKGTKTTGIKIGILQGEWNSEMLWEKLHEKEIEAAYFEIIDASKQQSVVWLMYMLCDEQKISALTAEINLIMPKNLPKDEPKKRLERIKQEIVYLEKENEELSAKLEGFADKRQELELFYDKLKVRREKYSALANIGITENVFFLDGYLPEKESEQLKKELTQKFKVAVEIKEPNNEEDVPIEFQNNAFVEPVVGITADYSMPSKHDIDPNPIMAIFYYFFFGMMFSDAGYGLLLMIVCGLLGFGNFIDKEKRRAYKMFFFCGVSTTFWGIMYGSFFGDMINTVSKVFGTGAIQFTPILVDPVKKPLTVLIMSVAFGAVHILTAMAIKFYMTWREGDRWGAIFDTGFWMIVIIGIGVLATGSAFGVDLLFEIGKWMAIGGAVGLVLTQGRSSKNPILKLFNGILSLYDITSIVGDLLSYSRLMALGLATGVIASVINVLGSLGGNTVAGLISFIAISIFGHLLNFAINMLGAYVHTNRLQYVEFYQKFYEGGGKKYNPLSLKTKYYEFK